MNGKRKGNRNERRSMALLEAEGYACTRSAASLGAFDVIGVGAVDVVLVQVKSSEWPRKIEMDSMAQFKVPPNCRKLVHRWRDRQRRPDVKVL